ncbi:MAG: phosphate ABC transporter substrate-binding protein PstS [Chloroflexi bacterium]|nr:phosphate ABC transporter substrate-binding protein PstS [Chloroflexota bacterium]
MSLRDKRIGWAAVLAVALLVVASMGVLAAGCDSGETTTTSPGAQPTTSGAPLQANLNGAGATFPQPIYTEWIGAFQTANPGVKINYQGVGSGAGIQQFTAQTVDFGASDAFMKPDELQAAEAARAGAKVLHIPTVFGSIVLAYNLPGVDKLKLDSDTLAKIFLGTITKWDDPALKALNPDATLPSETIQTVHRSDSSGTTNAFTSYLTAVNADWKAGPGAGKEVKWIGGVGGKGNDGVAAVVKQTEGAIGYVELAYAVQNNMTMADMKNKAGNFVSPSLDTTSLAADLPSYPKDFDLLPVVNNSENPQAYPIVTSTYLLAYDKMPDAAKAAALKAFITWALSDEGDAIAKDLGYAPLPASLKTAVLQEVALIGS